METILKCYPKWKLYAKDDRKDFVCVYYCWQCVIASVRRKIGTKLYCLSNFESFDIIAYIFVSFTSKALNVCARNSLCFSRPSFPLPCLELNRRRRTEPQKNISKSRRRVVRNMNINIWQFSNLKLPLNTSAIKKSCLFVEIDENISNCVIAINRISTLSQRYLLRCWPTFSREKNHFMLFSKKIKVFFMQFSWF